MNGYFSFDAETVGLYGRAYAVGAVVYNQKGEQIAKYEKKRELTDEEKKFAQTQIFKNEHGETAFSLPACIEAVSHLESFDSYEELLEDFAKFYLKYAKNSLQVVHMGHIVESFLVREMVRLKFLGMWDGAYGVGDRFQLQDVAYDLQDAGERFDSVDAYIEKHSIPLSNFKGGSHAPLYDSEAAALTYFHIHNIK